MKPLSSADMLAQARSRTATITVAEAKRLHAAGQASFIDVRDADERRTKGSIPGSVHASRGMLEFHLDPASDYFLPAFKDSRRIVFVCGSGGRATLAAATAQTMGVEGVVLEGGMRGWQEAGGEVER